MNDAVIAGRYRLVRRLGTGGMGSVWLAFDQELDAEVALKEVEVPSYLSAEQMTARVARARTEARNAAQLRHHPNVVTMLNVVEHEGLPWIVMEYAVGAIDLGKLLGAGAGPLLPQDTARIGAAVLDALTAGHRLGILHRDVKPANILLAPDHYGRQRARIMLTDYGISLRTDAEDTRLTGEGWIGTPGYLAPERARGAEPTPASDLFSLGVTLYAAVEGRAPFQRGTPQATIIAVLEEEPPPFQHASGPLTEVIAGLLIKDPKLRLNADQAAALLAQAQASSERVQSAGDFTGSTPYLGETLDPPPEIQAAAGPGTDTRPTANLARPTIRPGSVRRFATRRLIVPVVAVLSCTFGGFLLVKNMNGDGKPQHPSTASHRPSPTVSTEYPYGRQVGLLDGLSSGQCVTGTWPKTKLVGTPSLKTVDCDADTPDAQVVASVPATDARSALPQCRQAAATILQGMPDAVVYPLTRDPGYTRTLDTACLLFLQHAALTGPVGRFRKIGDTVWVTNMSTGDCFNRVVTKEKDTYETKLERCERPHHEQVIGWTWMAGTSGIESADLAGQCKSKYAPSWHPAAGQEIGGWYAGDDQWKAGFRWAMCTLQGTDSQKLPGGAARPVS